jgi:hypothetical protein
MGLDLVATGTCDKCGKKATIEIALTKLKPHAEMHLRLPEGWSVSSRPESGELLITCPTCPPTLVTVPPLSAEESLAMGPTIPPPPSERSR